MYDSEIKRTYEERNESRDIPYSKVTVEEKTVNDRPSTETRLNFLERLGVKNTDILPLLLLSRNTFLFIHSITYISRIAPRIV